MYDKNKLAEVVHQKKSQLHRSLFFLYMVTCSLENVAIMTTILSLSVITDHYKARFKGRGSRCTWYDFSYMQESFRKLRVRRKEQDLDGIHNSNKSNNSDKQN